MSMMEKVLSFLPGKEAADSPEPVAEKILEQLQSSVSWKRARGYYDDWPEYERFKRGDQWPKPTQDTAVYPRPVINIFESIIDQKVSAVLQEEPEITFLPREGAPANDPLTATDPTRADAEAAQMFSKVAKYTSEETNNDDLNEQIAETAALLGTGISYWYWDPGKRGGNPERMTAFEGDIAGDEIDPADIHVGNPREPDIQKQPWIIITARTPLQEFREFYRKHADRLGVDVASIRGSKEQQRDQLYDSERNEIDSTDYVDEIRRFRKVMNPETGHTEVWYEVVADSKLVRVERPLFQYSDRYPLAVFRWKDVRNCFFGEGEARNIIEAQKSVNRLLGLSIWSGYLTAWPKLLADEQQVDPTSITNQPGQLVRKRPGNWQGKALEYLQAPTIPGYVQQLFSELPEMVKTEAGVHEAMVGQAPSGELNAQAIMMLQKAAGIRISKISRNFRRYLKEVAQVWEAFWKEFYSEQRLIRITDGQGGREYLWFRGTDWVDFDFDVMVNSVPSTPYSEAAMVAELKEHLNGGRIDFTTYLENLPPNYLPQKEKIIEQVKQAQAQQQQQIISQLPPDQQEMFMQLSPEEQQEMLNQVQGAP
ncbi:portal protein [Desulforamulus ruminis]|uniref:Portal protein n=1 Tax=Desulforamulus ruminis (strain ATCC 23193 / DSM 2154 / NCIMB 8452 / DL) TaxID=696281 RepID=F6DM23_DESRL|nr:hypothetical protein [Desulforamulus ruminis]AEG59365.1 hypothetical protein Desru_1090 [Desulforamulus ruminis DSM 2154]